MSNPEFDESLWGEFFDSALNVQQSNPVSDSILEYKTLQEMMDEDPSLERYLTNTRTHEDNPFKEINIKVKDYHSSIEVVVVDFMIQLLAGYIWACRNDSNFIAMHDELYRVKSLYNKLMAYKQHSSKKPFKKKDPNDWFGENFVALSLAELAVLLPYLWD